MNFSLRIHHNITTNKRSSRIFLWVILALFGCDSHAQTEAAIQPGAHQMESWLPSLSGKNVGLLVNHTALVGETHLVDTVIARGISVKKVFTPEHGFRGQAPDGEAIQYGDTALSYSLISLYGKTKKAAPDQMANLDVLVIDMQDVGVRFYTYASTMTYVLHACALAGVPVILLDRPNPNGSYVDGPMMKPEAMSFIGMHPIPVVHGLTLGELAKMIVGEGWLESAKKPDLTVIPVKNWDHSMPYPLPVKPSPNLPNELAVSLYPSLAFFEGTVVSVGRGTDTPFQLIGHPLYAGSFSFTPVANAASKYPPLEGKTCFGDSFVGQEPRYQLDISPLIRYYHALKDQLDEPFFGEYFYRWAGSRDLETQIKNGWTEEQIRASWEEDLKSFRALRKKYLLYP